MSLPSGNCRQYDFRQISSARAILACAGRSRIRLDGARSGSRTSWGGSYRRHHPRSIFPGLGCRWISLPPTNRPPGNCRGRVSNTSASHRRPRHDEQHAPRRRPNGTHCTGHLPQTTNQHATRFATSLRTACGPRRPHGASNARASHELATRTIVPSFLFSASAKNQPALHAIPLQGKAASPADRWFTGGRLDVSALLQTPSIPAADYITYLPNCVK